MIATLIESFYTLSSGLLSSNLEPLLGWHLWLRDLQLLHSGSDEVVERKLERCLLLAA